MTIERISCFLQPFHLTAINSTVQVKITMTGSQVPVSCEISEDAMPESTESLSASVTEAMGAAHKVCCWVCLAEIHANRLILHHQIRNHLKK